MIKVSESLGVPKSNVEYWMDKHRIARRPLRKYPRRPFSEVLTEKAYLLGLRFGDLHVERYGIGIRVSTTTTRPGMLVLFYSIFKEYGHISVTPSFNKGREEYQWSTKVILDSSFAFLLSTRKRIPEWVCANKSLFHHFLAGFTDAEGTVGAVFRERFGGRFIEPYVSITNTKKSLLRQIVKLAKAYHPKLTLGHTAGERTSRNYSVRKHDQWRVTFWRRGAVRELLSNLPLRHPEKIELSRMVVEFIGGCEWEFAKRELDSFKLTTKREVENLARQARRQLRS